jgi:hypothetical protein
MHAGRALLGHEGLNIIREVKVANKKVRQGLHLPKKIKSLETNRTTKIRITQDSEAAGDIAAAYDFWRTTSGRKQVPGIIKCCGARPDFLRHVVEFSNKVHFCEGHLTRRHKEMIASYVSYLNRCPY